MKITVSCVGGSARYFPGGGDKMEVQAEPGETLADVLDRLGVSKDLFMFALASGEKVDLSHRLHEGEDVVLVSPLTGG